MARSISIRSWLQANLPQSMHHSLVLNARAVRGWWHRNDLKRLASSRGTEESRACRAKMKGVIVIPTHRTGAAFLENLLASFQGYSEYPILIVILDYQQGDHKLFSPITTSFTNLPISLETMETNSFELGGLYTAYTKTDYDEFFLLPHSCEIVNRSLFDIIFNKCAGRSVAFGLQGGNWKDALGPGRHNEEFVLSYLDKATNKKLLELGNVKFWQGHVGKYRRAILDKMDLFDFLPNNMIEAISKSELLFTSAYHSLDRTTAVLFQEIGRAHV
jgi:hypothetical protein